MLIGWELNAGALLACDQSDLGKCEGICEFRLKRLKPKEEALLVFIPDWIWCNAGRHYVSLG